MRKTLGELDATAGQSAIQRASVGRALWATALTPMEVARVGRVLWLVHLRRETFDASAASDRSRLGAAPAAAEARPRTVSVTTMGFQFRRRVSSRDGGTRGTQHHLDSRFEAPQGCGMEL